MAGQWNNERFFMACLRKVVLYTQQLQIKTCYILITRKPRVVHEMSKVKGDYVILPDVLSCGLTAELACVTDLTHRNTSSFFFLHILHKSSLDELRDSFKVQSRVLISSHIDCVLFR